MNNRDTILKSIQFIEKNLKNEIEIFDVANEICYSLYHFIRLFQSISGYSPKNYLQHRRLSQALFEIRDTDKKISEIAYEYQYGSPESFTRAFRKQFKLNPSDIRKGVSIDQLPILNPISDDYILQSDRIKNQTPDLLQCDERILVGISFFVPNDHQVEDLSNEWNQFMREAQSLKHKLSPERYYQVQYWSETQDINGMYFFIDTEVSKQEDIPPLFVVKSIPAGRYLRFIHKGLANRVGYTYKYIYNQYLPNTDYKLSKAFNFEYYGEKCLGPYNEKSESEIFIPID